MIKLYIETFGKEPYSITRLSGAGSNRQYFRLADDSGKTIIGVKGENRKENHAFLSFSAQMCAKGLSVPKIIAVADDEMSYLQEDLGDVSLYDLIEKSRKESDEWSPEVVALLHKIMKDLPRIQFETADGMDFSSCMREQKFSAMNIRWDLNYFKYCFLKLTGLEIDEILLEKDFADLEKKLLSMPSVKAFLYRDFQSRNIMIKEGMPYYIDYQGGYEGPFYYDVASFLWQVRAAYSDDLRRDLLEIYYESLTHYYIIDKPTFMDNLNYFVYFRLLQVLGAYGFRGLHEHKTMFISPISMALKQVLKFDGFPYIQELLTKASVLPQFQGSPAKGALTVKITSFSYKKGIPEDYSGNGGGFVFDCRAPHNPGRYAEYKKLTGLDSSVIDFLESESSMPDFISHVYALVDPAVETYLRREFSSLVVNFGCTGGQHRSVYCAQHLAEHLAEKFPKAKIVLTHRELGRYKEYNI